MEQVLTDIVFLAKNKVVSKKIINRYFYSIEKDKCFNQQLSSYSKTPMILFEQLGESDQYIVKEDILYLDFISQANTPNPELSDIVEDIDDVYNDHLPQYYSDIWKLVKKDFESFIGKKIKISYRYILSIAVQDTYDSWAGDGDVYYHLNNIYRFNNSKLIDYDYAGQKDTFKDKMRGIIFHRTPA